MNNPSGRPMSLTPRGRAQPQRRLERLAISLLLVAVLLIPHAKVLASPDENDQQRAWLPTASGDAFAGEIIYEFDSALNKTTVSYIAPLGRRDLLHRIFFAPPTVHTLTASYQFGGRIASHVPDTIRVRLESDEYLAATPGNQFVLGTERTMTIGVGEQAVQHSLSLSQRIEVDSTRVLPDRRGFSPRTQETIWQPQIRQAHVTRKATTWFSTCEFLSLIDQREIRGNVAGLEFSLNREVVTGLKLFAAGMLPEGAEQRSVDCSVK